jgi:uncharacterized membrane protein YpjA
LRQGGAGGRGGAGGFWLRRLFRAAVALPERRAAFWVLALINLGGFGFGIWWYWGQIAATPWWLLPLVPDSPLSTLLFGVLLLFLLQGRRAPVLAGLAYVNMVKYGLWTPFIIGGGVVLWGRVAFDDVHLTLSHLGMAIEALVYARYFPVPWPYLLAGAGWNLVNDCADYFGGLYPLLPHPALTSPARTAAFVLTCAAPLMIAAVQRLRPASPLAVGCDEASAAARAARLRSAGRRGAGRRDAGRRGAGRRGAG